LVDQVNVYLGFQDEQLEQLEQLEQENELLFLIELKGRIGW